MLAVALAAAPGLVQVVLLLTQHSAATLWGDQALLNLASHRAADLHQLRGVYSRYGFHEPGPAVFYVLAPFVAMLEGTGRGAYLGSAAVNATAAGAVAWLVVARFGASAGLWAAAVVDLYAYFLDVRLLRQPWNPYLIVVPMVLFVVLWVLSLLRTRGAWLWLSVVGSYEVQTHLATGFFVVGMVAVAATIALVRSGRDHSLGEAVRDWRRPARMAGAAMLVAVWVPTVVEMLVDRPNNVLLLWRFFTSIHAEPSLRSAVGMAASAISVVPLGNRVYTLVIHRNHSALAAEAVALVALSLVALAVGHRRHQPAAAAFVTAATAGVLVGVYSLTRAAGGVMLYFALWLSFVPVAVLLGLGVAALGRSAGSGIARWSTTGAVALAALLAAVPAVWQSARLPPAGASTHGVANVTASLAYAAEKSATCHGSVVYLHIGNPALWPEAAGIASVLRRQGCVTRAFPAQWNLLFGRHGKGLPVKGSFSLYLSPGPRPPHAGRTVATVGNQVLAWSAASSGAGGG